MKKFTHLFGIFMIALLSISTLQAQEESLDGILEKYYEKIGSVEKWKELKNMKLTGNSTAMGMTSPVIMYMMEPNLTKREMNIMGKEMVIAFDGTDAWMINPFDGSEGAKKQGEEASKQSAKQKFQDELIDYKEKGHQLELTGTEEWNGADAYKVKMTKKNGDVMFYYFDAKEFVPVMLKTLITTGPSKGEIVEILMRDYKEVDELYIAHTMEQKIGGKSLFSFTAETVEFNVKEIDASLFAMPAKE